MVLVDVIVADGRGQFVPGLKAEDFTVKEDGKLQRIAGFSSLSRRVVPTNVPLVPSAATKCVTRPEVCCQISLAVVR